MTNDEKAKIFDNIVEYMAKSKEYAESCPGMCEICLGQIEMVEGFNILVENGPVDIEIRMIKEEPLRLFAVYKKGGDVLKGKESRISPLLALLKAKTPVGELH